MTRDLRARFFAFVFATTVTLGLLGAVDGYATAEPSPQMLAHVLKAAAKA